MSVRADFANIYLQGTRDRSIRAERNWRGKSSQLTGQQQETCLTGPLEYKYRVIFVLVLGVICTLRSAVGS